MDRRRFFGLAGALSAGALFGPGAARALAGHLRRAYPGRRVVHYAQGCGYDWIAGE